DRRAAEGGEGRRAYAARHGRHDVSDSFRVTSPNDKPRLARGFPYWRPSARSLRASPPRRLTRKGAASLNHRAARARRGPGCVRPGAAAISSIANRSHAMKIVVASAVLLGSIALSSASVAQVETRQVPPFSKLSVAHGIDVELRQTDRENLRIE